MVPRNLWNFRKDEDLPPPPVHLFSITYERPEGRRETAAKLVPAAFAAIAFAVVCMSPDSTFAGFTSKKLPKPALVLDPENVPIGVEV